MSITYTNILTHISFSKKNLFFVNYYNLGAVLKLVLCMTLPCSPVDREDNNHAGQVKNVERISIMPL